MPSAEKVVMSGIGEFSGDHRVYLVADVGGTTLRAGYVAPGADQVTGAHRETVQGIALSPDAPVAELQRRVVAQLIRVLSQLLEQAPTPVASVGVAFAGPVNAAGEVSDAPTIWGPRGESLPLVEQLARALGRPVHVLNDVTAAGWRYVSEEPEDFCIVTVSSGVGNKVFCRGEVLLNPDGFGGEIGHLRVDLAPTAPLCDCGGRGHLAAFASGRAVLALTKARAERTSEEFASSILQALCCGDPVKLTNEHIAAAIRADDTFAVAVLRTGLVRLAQVLATLYATIGIRRFIIMGGFALAVGEPYLRHLGDELQRMCRFGLPPEEVPGMLRLAAPDDDHGLLGCARCLQHLSHRSRDFTTASSERKTRVTNTSS